MARILANDRLTWWQRMRYGPFFAQLVIIRCCNLHCGYCNEYDQHSPPIMPEVLRERIDHLKRLGTFGICFTGGEPTLHSALPELVAYARRTKRFFRTGMITNGTYLTPPLIESLNRAGLQIMQISIDGVKRNATTVKVLESLRKRLADLREHARFQVVVSGVVGAAPPDETFEVIATAKAMGFRPRVLVVHGPDGQIRLSAEERKGYTRLQKMIGRHLFEFSRYRHQLVTTGEAPFKCRAGSRYLYVDEYGTVGWCSQTRQFFGKPLAEYTYGDLRRQFHTPKACHRQCTLGCVRSSSVFDAWRPQKKSPHRLETDAGISVQSKIA